MHQKTYKTLYPIILYSYIPISYNPILAQKGVDGQLELKLYPGMHSVLFAIAPR